MEPLNNIVTDIDHFIAAVVPAEKKAAFFDVVRFGSREQLLKEIYKYTGTVPVKVDDVLDSWLRFYPHPQNSPQTLPAEETSSGDGFSIGGLGILESGAEISLHHKHVLEESIGYQEKERQKIALLKEFHEIHEDETKMAALLKKMDTGKDKPDDLFNENITSLEAQLDTLTNKGVLQLSEEQKTKIEERKKALQEKWLKQEPQSEEEKKRLEKILENLKDPKVKNKEGIFRLLLEYQQGRVLGLEDLLQEEQIRTTLFGRKKVVKKSILTKEQTKQIAKKQEKENKEGWKTLNSFVNKQRGPNRSVVQVPEIIQPSQAQPETIYSQPEEYGPVQNMPNPMNLYRTGEGAMNVFRTGQNVFNAIRGGGLASGAAEAAGAAGATSTAPVWGVALAILVGVFLIIIVLLVVLNLLQGQGANVEQQTAVMVTCGDKPINFTGNAQQLAQLVTQKFRYDISKANSGIVISTLQNTQQYNNDLLSAEKEIYGDMCILFGHISGISYNPQTLNTFGTLIVGSKSQVQSNQAVPITWIINVANTTAPCSFKLVKMAGDSPIWEFNYSPTCDSGQVKFAIAQNLAHNLILQQQHLAKIRAQSGTNANIYSYFTSVYSANIMAKSTILPTNDCINNVNYGESAKDQQNRDCFSDMVGAYFTYPSYFDAPITPTPVNPTSASASNTPNPLLDFPIGKYAEYYNFAKTYLFDGEDLFAQPTTNISRINTFLSDVGSCEGNFTHMPIMSCIRQEISHYLTTQPVDSAFVSALQNVTHDYQCGQFIWSVQKLMGWRIFPSNVAAVYDWYTMYPDHHQTGYTFIPNSGKGSDIKPGDIIIYAATPSDGSGHIAIVIKVQSDKFNISVAEANYRPGTAWTRNTTLDDTLGKAINSRILGWWRKI